MNIRQVKYHIDGKAKSNHLGWIFLVIAAVLIASSFVRAGVMDEERYQSIVIRNADGSIHRSAAVIAAFRRIHPCPSTMKFTGACPGWSVNHVIPLACGGVDSVSNMQWLPNDIKSCAGPHCVDRFERKINAATPPYPDTANCRNVLVP